MSDEVATRSFHSIGWDDLRISWAITECIETKLEKFFLISKLLDVILYDVCLQLGDLETAQSYFKQVESKATGDPNSLSSVVMNK